MSQHIIPAISSLSKDKNWRTRLTMIELTSFITDLMGKTFFHNQLWNIYKVWLNDPVFSIRKAASINLKDLTLLLGPKFVKQTLLNCLVEMSVQNHYKERITALFALTVSTVTERKKKREREMYLLKKIYMFESLLLRFYRSKILLNIYSPFFLR